MISLTNQYGVPMKDFLLPKVSVMVAEIPKSASFTAPDTVNKVFAP